MTKMVKKVMNLEVLTDFYSVLPISRLTQKNKIVLAIKYYLSSPGKNPFLQEHYPLIHINSVTGTVLDILHMLFH